MGVRGLLEGVPGVPGLPEEVRALRAGDSVQTAGEPADPVQVPVVLVLVRAELASARASSSYPFARSTAALWHAIPHG